MLDAIVQTEGMRHFFKLTGPVKSVKAARAELDELLGSITLKWSELWNGRATSRIRCERSPQFSARRSPRLPSLGASRPLRCPRALHDGPLSPRRSWRRRPESACAPILRSRTTSAR